MAKKHGVLVLQGKDHRQQFWACLRLLTEDPGTLPEGAFEPASINMIWVRKFGPIGVVQLRFETNDDTLSYLCTRLPQSRIDRTLRAANPDLYAQQDHEPPLLVVAEAGEPRHLDPTIEHQIWEGRSEDLPGQKSGEHEEDHRLQRFAAMLASFPGLELAQYDSARYRDPETKAASLFQIFRLFDHQRRGPGWLQRRVEEAQELVYSHPDKARQGECAYKLEKQDPSGVGAYLNKILRIRKDFHDDVLGPEHIDRYLYLLVHCTDRPGLFADLSSFLQSEPGANRRPARRKIFLGACRGMGEQGIVMLAARADGTTDADETALNQRLHKLMEARRRGVDVYSRRMSDGRFHVHDARVFVSTEIPGMVNAGDHSHGYITVEAKHPLDAPGLLRGLCEHVNENAGSKANFYLVDGRSHRRPGETEGSFGLAMGLVVSSAYGPTLKESLDRYLFDTGWTQVRVEWQAF
ncbi:MAG: hypothetical protein QM783_12180 [Phycisphaerales bacterium]